MRRWVSFESKSAQPARQGRPQAPPLAGLVSERLAIYAARSELDAYVVYVGFDEIGGKNEKKPPARKTATRQQ